MGESMSLDFAVFCRNRPHFNGEHDVGPVRLSAPEKRTDEDSWWLQQLPEAATSDLGDWVVRMNCRSSAGESAEYLGTLIAERSGGGWVMCDAGEEAVQVAATTSAVEDILSELQRLMQVRVNDRQAFAARQLELAKSEHEKAKQKDPTAFVEADDWSKV